MSATPPKPPTGEKVEPDMSFRDDDDAQRCYHDDLARELARLEARLSEMTTVAAERERIAAQLAQVRRDVEAREARRGPVRLPNLKVATPCRERWDDMVGDDRVRVCGRCEKPVFNLSAMTHEEAETVLATRGVTPCVRFFRRADGTVKTADCPSRKRAVVFAVAGGALAAAGVAFAMHPDAARPAPTQPHAVANAIPEHELPTMGQMALDPATPEPPPIVEQGAPPP